MEHDEPAAYSAWFRNLELKTWEVNRRHSWTVHNSETAEQIASGEAADLATAMVGAAEAAGADWGSVKWRSRRSESDESGEIGDEPEGEQT